MWPRGLCRSIALLVHDRGTRRWVSGQQHAPAALYPREKTRYPLYRRLGGPQGLSRRRRISRPPEYDPGPSGSCINSEPKIPNRTDYIVEIWFLSAVPSTSQLAKCRIPMKIELDHEARAVRNTAISLAGMRNRKRKSVKRSLSRSHGIL